MHKTFHETLYKDTKKKFGIVSWCMISKNKEITHDSVLLLVDIKYVWHKVDLAIKMFINAQ